MEWFSQMEAKLKEMHTKEDDSLFYYHSSEDRIVLSHAMFWTMTQLQFFKSKIRKEKLPSVTTFSPRDSLSKLSSPLGLPKEFFLLLRQYQEEMLDAFLQDDDYFSELLHYCNIQYELLPTILIQKEIIRSSFPPHIADRMCAAIDGQEKMEHFVRFLNEYNEWMGMQQKQQAAVMELATPSSVTTRQCSCKHGTAFAVPSVFKGV